MITQLLHSALILLLVATSALAQIEILRVETSLGASGLPAAGGLATLYCTGLTGIDGLITPTTTPLPTTIAGVRINFGSVDAPLLAIKNVREANQSYQQINFQVPYEVSAAPRLIQGAQSADLPTALSPWGQLFPIAQHALDYRPVTAFDPPKAGEAIILYGTNFGSVTVQQTSGVPSPSDPLVKLSTLIVGLDLWKFRAILETVISEQQLDLEFAGLAPGTIGVYQFNVRMPDPLPPLPGRITFKRAANCGARFSPGCGTGLRIESSSYLHLN